MSKNIETPIDIAIAAIKSAPRMPGRGNPNIHWAADKTVMAKVAIAIIGARDPAYAMTTITGATGVQPWTMKHFIRGRNASGGAEQVIIDAIKAAGLDVYTVDGRKRNGKYRNSTPPADTVPPANFTITHPSGPTTSMVVKPATLAVTNKGEVITATPPPAATTPTAMVAQGGDFAVKTNTTRCVLDTKTNDILVINTTRITFGTPEWCAKMVDINRKP